MCACGERQCYLFFYLCLWVWEFTLCQGSGISLVTALPEAKLSLGNRGHSASAAMQPARPQAFWAPTQGLT